MWLRSEQVGLALGAAARAGLRVTGVGTPEAGRAGPLAELITQRSGQACEAHDDLRAALSRTTAGVVWLLTPGLLGQSDAGDGAAAEAVRGCAARGVRVASLEPLPGSLLGLSAAGGSGGVVREAGGGGGGGDGGGFAQGWCALCPAVRWLGPMRDAAALLEQFGPVRAASVRCLGSPVHGSLGARLFEAMDLVHMFVGEPEVIDAAYVGPSGSALHAAPGETLSRLGGEMTANGRLPGKAVSVLVSDRVGERSVELDLIGAGGRLRVSVAGLVWTDPSGREVDRSGGLFGAEGAGAERGGAGRGGARRKRGAPGGPAAGAAGAAGASGAAGAIGASAAALEELSGAQLARLLSDGPGALGGINFSRVLAMAQAAVLSARTGEGESPATMRRMAGLA
ncbi:MAG: hypothetical protein C0475_03295 [Planctomyces sp.]|nr:hypothetical protein [Planctomyces sp.]